MKRYITLALCLIPWILCSLTRQVAVDGSQPYTSIQAAINAAVSGDIVLVHPGRYLENLNLSDKNGIILCSLEYTTGDTTYVSSTIIDGSNANTSTILCYQNTVNCTIRGVSITGGRGYTLFEGASPRQIFGGGIFIYENCILNIINTYVFDNVAAWGGGITILASNTVSMSNVNIYNNIARYRAGGLDIGSDLEHTPIINFDQVNRCSIYNNFAQWGMDIDWYFINGGTVQVYLKKFTVPQWEKYYADFYEDTYPPSPYTVFDIQEAYLQPVEADLYVSPFGNDNNDGLTPSSALKTPSRAMQRVASNPLTPRTVHLMAGEHRNLFAGEYIPIAIKDHTVLQGASQAQTSLYGEGMIEGTGVVTMGIERYGMTLKDLSITTTNASAIFSWGLYDSTIENITIANSTVDRWLIYSGYITSTFSIKNVTMRDNTAILSDFGMNLTGSIIEMDNIVMQNNQTQSLPQFDYLRGCGGFDIGIAESLIISNSKFVNNTHYSEDGWANFRVYTDPSQFQPTVTFDNCLFAANSTEGGARNVQINPAEVSNIVNCTFANNVGAYSDYILLGTNSSRIINSIFCNNNAVYEIRSSDATIIENCLFSRTDNIWRTFSGHPLSWGETNLTGANPLFSGIDPSQPGYYGLYSDAVHGFSPAINAGTTDPSVLPVGYQIPEADAFGYSRLFGNSIDIGCFESPGYTDTSEGTRLPINQLSLTNYPNPFNPRTTISYNLPKDGKVNISIYNIKGQLVKTLLNEPAKSGVHSIVWNGDDHSGSKVSAGLYFTRIEANGESRTLKIMLLK